MKWKRGSVLVKCVCLCLKDEVEERFGAGKVCVFVCLKDEVEERFGAVEVCVFVFEG